MDAIENTQRAWFRASAESLVASKGVEHARKVQAFHRSKPMPGAEFYPDLIEEAIQALRAAA